MVLDLCDAGLFTHNQGGHFCWKLSQDAEKQGVVVQMLSKTPLVRLKQNGTRFWPVSEILKKWPIFPKKKSSGAFGAI